ncbi:MAG: hypothetical protein NTX96_01555 [Candidatus Zambryskibacteria bacterium]|nr:hypothetical protein [Candidatus Zambryskibacteria bacterium]
MSKKLLIIIISVVLGFFLVSLIGYYFIIQNSADTSGGGNSIFKNFFPFGGNTVAEIPVTGEPIIEPTPPEISNYALKLRKISAEPVAGAGVLDFKAGTVVRYIEKATGHIYETELFSPNQNRISNTTIPMVYDAIWGNKNNSLIARYLKDDNQTIDTYGLLIKGISTTTENLVSAVKFPENLNEMSVFGSSVFSLEQKIDSSVGYISNFDGSRRTQIWNYPIRELLSQYVNAKTVALTTKPDQNTEGFLFFVDTGNGQIRRILGNVFGLSVLVNDLATQILFLDQGGAPQMFVFDIKNKSSISTTPTTFPEKCVWSKKDRNIIYCAVPQEFIDRDSLTLWYRGFVSFTDDIWKYNIKNNTSSVVESLVNESNEQIDVIKPMLSENEQYLVFINKIDNSLWSLDLTK